MQIWYCSLLCNIMSPTQYHRNSQKISLGPGLWGSQTWYAECDGYRSVQPQSLEPLHTSTLHPLSCHLFIQDYSFFSLRAFRSLIYILCTFFLKLPKILHKGKLCSLFYALSDEAKYPLIVDQRRQKNLEANDKRQAIAT